jgi:hypothetical protein
VFLGIWIQLNLIIGDMILWRSSPLCGGFRSAGNIGQSKGSRGTKCLRPYRVELRCYYNKLFPSRSYPYYIILYIYSGIQLFVVLGARV